MKFLATDVSLDGNHDELIEFLADDTGLIICSTIPKCIELMNKIAEKLDNKNVVYTKNVKNLTLTFIDEYSISFYSVIQVINGSLRGKAESSLIYIHDARFKNEKMVVDFKNNIDVFSYNNIFHYVPDCNTMNETYRKLFLSECNLIELSSIKERSIVEWFKGDDCGVIFDNSELKDRLDTILDNSTQNMIEANRKLIHEIGDRIMKHSRSPLSKLIDFIKSLFTKK